MDTQHLRDLLPRDKSDVERAKAIRQIGLPTVWPIMPEILEWLQDANWPVAKELHSFVISIGSSLAPLVVPILNGSDDTWKYFILSSVVSYSPDLAQALVSELERIAFFPTPSEKKEEVAGVAKEILRSRQKQSNDFEVKMVQPDSF